MTFHNRRNKLVVSPTLVCIWSVSETAVSQSIKIGKMINTRTITNTHLKVSRMKCCKGDILELIDYFVPLFSVTTVHCCIYCTLNTWTWADLYDADDRSSETDDIITWSWRWNFLQLMENYLEHISDNHAGADAIITWCWWQSYRESIVGAEGQNYLHLMPELHKTDDKISSNPAELPGVYWVVT